MLRDDFHWFAKDVVPEAQAPIATRAGGSREGPEFVLRRTSLTSSISISTTTMLLLLLLLLFFFSFLFLWWRWRWWWWWSSSFSPVYCIHFEMIIIVTIFTVHSHVYHLAYSRVLHLREICPCGKSHQRLQAQKDLQMANGEGSEQSEAETFCGECSKEVYRNDH